MVRGIFFNENSGKVVGKPEPENERWNRFAPSRKTQKTDIFPDIRYSLGEVYGGARVWQESCAWGREKSDRRSDEPVRNKKNTGLVPSATRCRRPPTKRWTPRGLRCHGQEADGVETVCCP